jgi:hypothetical protein
LSHELHKICIANPVSLLDVKGLISNVLKSIVLRSLVFRIAKEEATVSATIGNGRVPCPSVMKAKSDGGTSMLVALSGCVREVVAEFLADVLPNAAGIGLTCLAVQLSGSDVCLGYCQ